MENGRPVYSIIQEIKTAPLSILDEVLKDIAGASVNEEYFQIWKGDDSYLILLTLYCYYYYNIFGEWGWVALGAVDLIPLTYLFLLGFGDFMFICLFNVRIVGLRYMMLIFY